jgi:hypothetical protein
METPTNVKPIDKDEALQISGGSLEDFGCGALWGLILAFGCL